MDSSSADQPLDKDQVVVYGMVTPDGEPSLSPFCLKLETYLMLAKIPYVRAKEFVKSKKQKVPWISYNGEQVADSQFCIEYLSKKFGIDLSRDLTTEQRAIAHAFRTMMDEYHFWCNAYFQVYKADDPWLVKFFPSAQVREDILARYAINLPGQGIGRHSEEEIIQMFCANLQAVQDYLGDKPFLMGESPTEVDCSVYAYLGALVYYTPQRLEEHLGKDYLKNKLPKLFDYFLRMKERTYPNYKI